MRFRSIFFGVLCLISLAWIAYGFSATGQAFDTVVNDDRHPTPFPNSPLSREETQAFRTVGAGIGASFSLSFFLCTGLPFAVLFGLLSWRNNAGYQNEQRHNEMMFIQMQQAHALHATATAQIMQTRNSSPQPNYQPPALPSLNDQMSKAWQLIKSGNLEKARPIVSNLYAANKSNPDILYLVSHVTPDREKQIKALEKALTINPNHKKSLERLNELNDDDFLL